MRTFIFIFAIAVLVSGVAAQPLPEPEREFRAAWIATVDNIDFPTRKGLSTQQQKEELAAAVRLAKDLRLNALIFQVRPMADAIYRSELEPWSEFLTGSMGKGQDLDPLEFLVAEAHRQGILVHAWFNPYRAYHPAAKTVSDTHISKTRPHLVHPYGKYLWMDPTDAEVQKHSLAVILDVVKRYDLDGVHFDDYFYPYPEADAAGKDIDFPDDKNWIGYNKTAAANRGSDKQNKAPLGRDDWRRAEVNRFIETVGAEIRRIKPQIMYGISPFGIWRPMPDKNIKGLDAYAKLYADSRKWLQDGTVDYLAPQLYWETAREGQSFPVLLDWWRSQNTKKRHIWPGIAAYRIGSTDTFSSGEIASQVNRTRKDPLTSGTIYFSFRSLRTDMGGIQERLKGEVYRRNAIVPVSPWKDPRRPPGPQVKIKHENDKVYVRWEPRPGEAAFWYIVYVKDRTGWNYSIVPATENSAVFSKSRGIEKIEIKAVSRLGAISR